MKAAGQNTAMSSVEDGYHRISAEEAKSVMDENTDAVILDVREQDEYDSGHIPGAVLLPVNSIDETRRSAGDSHKRYDSSGILPQRKSQPHSFRQTGRTGLYTGVRVRRYPGLAV